MPSRTTGTQKYFDAIPAQWDDLYESRNLVGRTVNRILRKGVYERFRLTFEECGRIEGSSVLDIGCGTGSYSIEFARRGASRVLGLDFAPAMVAFASESASQAGVADRCEFVCRDFMESRAEGPFDIVFAMGFFDYVADPEPVLNKIASLTRGLFLASFPSNGPIWRIQRRIRYNWLRRCPVYEYREPQLKHLLTTASFTSLKLVPMSGGLFVVASKLQ